MIRWIKGLMLYWQEENQEKEKHYYKKDFNNNWISTHRENYRYQDT